MSKGSPKHKQACKKRTAELLDEILFIRCLPRWRVCGKVICIGYDYSNQSARGGKIAGAEMRIRSAPNAKIGGRGRSEFDETSRGE
jgi:hypothetical protein